MKPKVSPYVIAFVIFAAVPVSRAKAEKPTDDSSDHDRFQVMSTSFSSDGSLPLDLAYNQCPYYPGGGDQSPELSWIDAPRHARSFVVIAYDTTASFTHWGMYNISHRATSLPANAGIAGSTLGTQIANDFGDQSYDGPCPPL